LLNLLLWGKHLIEDKGKVNQITIEAIIAITPPSLLGIDRNIA